MKNISLCIAGFIFLIFAVVQFLRYYFGIVFIIGNGHHIPLVLSLAGSIFAGVLAIWMLVAALIKPR